MTEKEKKGPPVSTLDLDFSDLKGEKKEVKKESDVLNEDKKKKKQKTKRVGLTLSIPIGPEQWESKEIEDCSGDEFLRWAKGVYPRVSAKPERFNNLKKRLEAYQRIAQYHKLYLTREQLETKH
jgi:acyl carrier protein phosphodiesterase